MKHFRVVFKPDGREISIHEGATLLEAARQAGIILATACGGKGTCGKCALRLHPSGQQVLACQHQVQDDLAVVVPPESRFYEHKILDHGIAAGAQIHPTVYRKYQAGAGIGKILGVAVDIGTTTVVAKLLNLASGQCLATKAVLNPQTRFGDDVVSRISYAQSEEHLAELHNVIIECINTLIDRLCRQAGVPASSIYEASIVGNTTMNHIFLRLPVEQLGRAPYRAWSVEAHDVPPLQLGIAMNPAGNVHCAENIAGFVGADTTAVALAVDMDSIDDRVLVVDIGTNGEIVLGTRAQLYAASCAAGPALEGARIKHGSRAADGAVEAVVFNGDITLDTIGTSPPRSICGSGLIDAVAVLLDLGIVDATGRFLYRQGGGASLLEPIASRIREHQGQPAFCLARSGQTSLPDVILTQRDIREVQLAKAAIRAGIRILMDKLGMTDRDIDRVLLAGAFGNYIRPSSAVRIGLLPNVPLDRIQSVGNAAATGAEILLISEECRERAARLARKIQYIEIAHEKNFNDVFADAMFLSP
ncbi:MAG: ASKHA domain-containing protein [Phycisphaerae bacterium]|nr:ASKHA domain-containing protein [Phycisphaerae bacterium]